MLCDVEPILFLYDLFTHALNVSCMLHRRLIRISSEDVGMADARALPLCVSAYQACHFVGMPECELALAQVGTNCRPRKWGYG